MSDWFDRLAGNRYIEIVILANNQGQLLRSSRPIASEEDLIPSMLQALEVLAQTLAAEFNCGAAQMVQLATEQGHLLLFPQLGSTYYVAVLVERTAPLMLILIELERTLGKLTADDFALYDTEAELDADQLIEAVREWLRGRPRQAGN